MNTDDMTDSAMMANATVADFTLSGYQGGVDYSNTLVIAGSDVREGFWTDIAGNRHAERCW